MIVADRGPHLTGSKITGRIDQMILIIDDRKIDQLASVIAAMNVDQRPDSLGVCEVEKLFCRRSTRRSCERNTARAPKLCGRAGRHR